MLKRLFSRNNQSLLAEMIGTDFKLRYQGSVLGYLWSLLKPLMLFAILYIVFTQFLRIGRGVPNYAISLLLGIVLWNFFAESTSMALKSIVARGSLIRKISIPRWTIPVAAISSAFINMLLNLVVVFVFIFFAKNNALSWSTLFWFPLLLVELIIISVATGFFLSALFVKYRDAEHIWDITKQALFYVTPIIYPLSLVPSEQMQKLLILNPLAQIIQDARAITTYSETPQISHLYMNVFAPIIPLLLIIVALIVSAMYFRKQSKHFAEDI